MFVAVNSEPPETVAHDCFKNVRLPNVFWRLWLRLFGGNVACKVTLSKPMRLLARSYLMHRDDDRPRHMMARGVARGHGQEHKRRSPCGSQKKTPPKAPHSKAYKPTSTSTKARATPLGNEAQSGRQVPSRARHKPETDRNHAPWGNVKRTLKTKQSA